MIRVNNSRTLLLAAYLIPFAQLIAPSPTLADDKQAFDCGTLSLYILLRLEGKTTDLGQITSHLPPVPASGYSMKELRDAAHEAGLELTGVKLKNVGRLDDGPSILYLNKEGHGHFVVIRPVGHTGNMIQMFDSARYPTLLDVDSFRNSQEWTGLVLIKPARSRFVFYTGIAMSICLVSFGLLFLMKRLGTSSS